MLAYIRYFVSDVLVTTNYHFFWLVKFEALSSCLFFNGFRMGQIGEPTSLWMLLNFLWVLDLICEFGSADFYTVSL